MEIDIKAICAALQAPPFKRDVNPVVLDQLNDQQRLQLLSDVVSELEGFEPNQGPDIHYESQTDTISRIKESLVKFNFDPERSLGINNIEEFVTRLVKGEQLLIFKTLEFLVLNDISAMKKRAYLANFLKPIDVPYEYQTDPEVKSIYAEYQELLKTFESTHKSISTSKTTNLNPEMTTEELRSELQKLDSEKSALQQRLRSQEARVKQAISHERESEKFIAAVKALKQEQTIAQQIQAQISKERHEVAMLEEQLGTGGLNAELQAAREMNDKSSGEILENLEADFQSLLFRKDRVNALINQKRSEMTNLENIARQQLFPRSEIANLEMAIEDEKKIVEELVREKNQRRINGRWGVKVN